MNARHVARELALLSLSQLRVQEEQLGQVTPEDLVEQAVRMVTSEARDNLKAAAADLQKAHEDVQESTLRDHPDAIRELLRSSIDHTERVINLLGAGLEWPLMVAMAKQEDVRRFAVHLIKLFRQHQSDVDQLIDSSMVNWSLERLVAVDRDILRLAVAEMLYEGTPFEVAIDEAVELAKQYSTEESGKFVNGVLKRLLPSVDAHHKGAGNVG